MWELDYKGSWVPKTWCFWNVALVKTLECPLDCKEIQPVHPKGNHFWILIVRTESDYLLKLKLQYFGHLIQRNDSFENTLMFRKIECRRRRGWQRMRLLDGITDSMDMSLSIEVGDDIWPPHPLLSPSPPAFNLSKHQGLFQGVSSLHQVAKV